MLPVHLPGVPADALSALHALLRGGGARRPLSEVRRMKIWLYACLDAVCVGIRASRTQVVAATCPVCAGATRPYFTRIEPDPIPPAPVPESAR